jgi:hypothetical protein
MSLLNGPAGIFRPEAAGLEISALPEWRSSFASDIALTNQKV